MSGHNRNDPVFKLGGQTLRHATLCYYLMEKKNASDKIQKHYICLYQSFAAWWETLEFGLWETVCFFG